MVAYGVGIYTSWDVATLTQVSAHSATFSFQLLTVHESACTTDFHSYQLLTWVDLNPANSTSTCSSLRPLSNALPLVSLLWVVHIVLSVPPIVHIVSLLWPTLLESELSIKCICWCQDKINYDKCNLHSFLWGCKSYTLELSNHYICYYVTIGGTLRRSVT